MTAPDAATTVKAEETLRLTLFAYEGPRTLTVNDVQALVVRESELLWVHASKADADAIRLIGAMLSVPDDAVAEMTHPAATPSLRHSGACFSVEVVAVKDEAMPQFPGETFTALCGKNFVITVAPGEATFLEDLAGRALRNPDVGALSAEGFLASLLDAHLTSYFQAASHIEAEVERLETRLMARRPSDCLEHLRLLRRATSRLRRMLAAHRIVFAALARPDFRPHNDERMGAHFSRLESQYERAMDVIEHGREQVLGSFDLFSTRLTMVTNDMMKILTFVTVLFGFLAVAAGVLGMNFEAPFFKAGAWGFWSALGGMTLASVAGLAWARHKEWM